MSSMHSTDLDQRRAAVERMLTDDPTASQRRIALALGVSEDDFEGHRRTAATQCLNW
jgi:hypothetical protein